MTDGLVERLAKRATDAWGYNDAGALHQARWWLLAIAEEIEAKGSTSIACNIVAADWLRTEAEGR